MKWLFHLFVWSRIRWCVCGFIIIYLIQIY
jgi:hypothetical protein